MSLLVFVYRCYDLIMESCHAFVSDPTLGAIGIELLTDEQGIPTIQQDLPFVRGWTTDDVG